MTDVTAKIRETAGNDATLQAVRARYRMLCELRDEANKKLGDLQSKLDKANDRCEKARRESLEIADQIQAIRGGADAWIALKHEIAQLSKVPGILATPGN